MHGPLEVFSQTAVTTWFDGIKKCVAHFEKQCGGDCYWGEDLFVDQCLWHVLGAQRENDYRLLVEDHCEPPKDWDNCLDSTRVAFHPFKTEKGYFECFDNAGDTSRHTTTTKAPVVRVEAPEPEEPEE